MGESATGTHELIAALVADWRSLRGVDGFRVPKRKNTSLRALATLSRARCRASHDCDDDDELVDALLAQVETSTLLSLGWESMPGGVPEYRIDVISCPGIRVYYEPFAWDGACLLAAGPNVDPTLRTSGSWRGSSSRTGRPSEPE